MSRIQAAITLLIDAFEQCSAKDGDKHTLTKCELKELLRNEFPDLLTKAPDQDAVDKFFSDLDRNKDNKVDFQEYVSLVASLTILCNKAFTCKK